MLNLFRKKPIDRIQADANAGYIEVEHPGGMRRNLGLIDLMGLGIAAIIGAGVFSMVGNASATGGPAVVFLFIFTAIACMFSALCYADFAARIPVSGSAYTYAYASFGELFAWIIGWDLLVEYAIGNIAVAISWSDYFTGLMSGLGWKIPAYFTTDYLSAARGFETHREAITQLTESGNSIAQLRSLPIDQLRQLSSNVSGGALEAFEAWTTAPTIGGFRIICDLPSLIIVFLITALVYVGIRESKLASNVMVALKLSIIAIVIVVGSFYVNPGNWSPFAPNGFGGVMSGVAAVFFAYIGFDALSTTAEECKNPRRDLPRAMIYSLVICTVLYCVLALVLTGMKDSKELAVGDPLAYVFGPQGVDLPWVSGIVAIGAIIAIATVLLVFQLGQPRLWMAMSRDGLLPPIFASLHPRFRTPWFSTILTGLLVAIPSLFMNLSEVTDLTVIGTLFAFVLVCGGVLVKDKEFGTENRYAKYINGAYFVPPAYVAIIWMVWIYWPNEILNLFSTYDAESKKSGWEVYQNRLPYLIFVLFATGLTALTFVKQLSLIPVLGVLSCTYLMTGLGITNWIRFLLWLLVGTVIYFFYGYSHSKLNRRSSEVLESP
jgi:basic amino acid/polyamine antiporter, APA family